MLTRLRPFPFPAPSQQPSGTLTPRRGRRSGRCPRAASLASAWPGRRYADKGRQKNDGNAGQSSLQHTASAARRARGSVCVVLVVLCARAGRLRGRGPLSPCKRAATGITWAARLGERSAPARRGSCSFGACTKQRSGPSTERKRDRVVAMRPTPRPPPRPPRRLARAARPRARARTCAPRRRSARKSHQANPRLNKIRSTSVCL